MRSNGCCASTTGSASYTVYGDVFRKGDTKLAAYKEAASTPVAYTLTNLRAFCGV
jgi:hypothetical protein